MQFYTGPFSLHRQNSLYFLIYYHSTRGSFVVGGVGYFFAWEGDFLFCLNTNCYTHTGYYFKINC